jgi:hypothetical protein
MLPFAGKNHPSIGSVNPRFCHFKQLLGANAFKPESLPGRLSILQRHAGEVPCMRVFVTVRWVGNNRVNSANRRQYFPTVA